MKIVVVGGGTAGWLGAYIISKAQKGVHEIVVVESSSIDIIGAGEGSTGLLKGVITGAIFGEKESLQEIDVFMKKTDATKKIGIRHANWTNEFTSYYAPLDASISERRSPDVALNYVISKFGNDKAYLASHMGQSFENNTFPTGDFAFHFDGRKVGPYFKDRLATNSKVSFVDGTVQDVVVSPNGKIEKLVLEGGIELDGDFFIDCTGFARVLMGKLESKWKSYKQHLPVDSAIPFISHYKDNNEMIEPVTTAHALSSGWMWDIPLQTRRGRGYVYSSEFISDEDARLEVSKLVGEDVQPLKQLKFNSGRLEELWKSNCLALGLGAGFSEPLEATSIHLTIYQSIYFCYEFLRKSADATSTKSNIEMYNKAVGEVYDDYMNFLVLHYQGGRDDSEFWRYIKEGNTLTPFVSEIMDRAKTGLPTKAHYKDSLGSAPQLWNYVISGLKLVDPASARETLELYGLTEQAEKDYNAFAKSYVVTPERFMQFIPEQLRFTPKITR